MQSWSKKRAKDPTRTHVAHKALLRRWAVDGVVAADEVLYDTVAPLFETQDSKGTLAAAVKAKKGRRGVPVL